MYHSHSSRGFSTRLNIVALTVVLLVGQLCLQVSGYQVVSNPRRNQINRNRPDRLPILKDSFYEDNNYLVKIRTTYNASSSITCNAILIEPNLVVSDVTCIKYSGIANIDAKFVQVIQGEVNETAYEVEQIYINKADPRDPGTELAMLKLSKQIHVESECRHLMKPLQKSTVEPETPVRVVGFTRDFELKENRTKVGGKKSNNSKYICTAPSDVNETPGSQLLKGAALLQIIDCKSYQLLGILAKTEAITESIPPVKKHQDCYVAISSMVRWFDQVKSLASLNGKNDGVSTQPSVVVVTLPEEMSEIEKQV